MNQRRTRSLASWIYAGSVILHVGFATVAVLLPRPERTEAVAIELADFKKKPPPKPAPPLPPPPKDEKPKPSPPRPAAPTAQAKIASEPMKTELLPPVEVGADGFADLGGVAVGGGTGEAVSFGGAASPASSPSSRLGAGARATSRRVEQLASATASTCNEAVIRPKRRTPVAPKYTMEARQAEVEGVVKVEVTVDEVGRVIGARVTSGLGYGLDESALKAAKDTLFEPATQCGKPVIGKAILPFRFEST